jgi:hypothetical protein
VLAEVAEHRRVRPERHDREVVTVQFRGERADRGGRGTDPLAAHRPRHVGQQHHAAPGPDPLADDDVVLLGHRVLDQLLDGPVEVDIV